MKDGKKIRFDSAAKSSCFSPDVFESITTRAGSGDALLHGREEEYYDCESR